MSELEGARKAEMTGLERRLTAALTDTAGTVRGETLRPLSVRRRPKRRWTRAVAPVAAAAAVVLVVGLDVGIGRMTAAQRLPGGPARPGTAFSVGGYPLRMVFDPADQTIYTLTGRQLPAADLTMIGTTACNAAATSGCMAVRHVPVPGSPVQDIAVDPRTRTLYVLSGSGQRDTVAVLDAAACKAADTAGCGDSRAVVHVPSGATALAVNPRNGSVYVTYNQVGQLSVINGRACNATHITGCATAAATEAAPALSASWPELAPDPVSGTLYYDGARGLTIIDGRTCSGADVLGCGKALATVRVPSGVSQVTIDQADSTLYVTESGAVAVIDRNRCSAENTTGCSAQATVRGGPTPVYEAADQSAHTLYVSGGDSGSVFMVDTSACHAGSFRGCSKAPASFQVRGAADLALDPAAHTLYVVSGAAGAMTIVNTDTCNASGNGGCPRTSPASTGALPGGQRHNPAYWCDSSLTQYDAGLPAGPFEQKAIRVARGSADGLRWSVWAKKGITDPYAIEQGGMVLNGRWYGLCQQPLSAGPGAGFAMIDAGSYAIVYGYIQHPEPVKVALSSGGQRWSPSSVLLTGTTFYISRLPHTACAYHAMRLSAIATRGPAWSGHLDNAVNSCTPGRLVTLSEEGGTWGAGSGN